MADDFHWRLLRADLRKGLACLVGGHALGIEEPLKNEKLVAWADATAVDVVCAFASGNRELAMQAGAQACGNRLLEFGLAEWVTIPGERGELHAPDGWGAGWQIVNSIIAAMWWVIARARNIPTLSAEAALDLAPAEGSAVADALLEQAVAEQEAKKDALLERWQDIEEKRAR